MFGSGLQNGRHERGNRHIDRQGVACLLDKVTFIGRQPRCGHRNRGTGRRGSDSRYWRSRNGRGRGCVDAGRHRRWNRRRADRRGSVITRRTTAIRHWCWDRCRCHRRSGCVDSWCTVWGRSWVSRRCCCGRIAVRIGNCRIGGCIVRHVATIYS